MPNLNFFLIVFYPVHRERIARIKRVIKHEKDDISKNTGH